MKKLGMMIFALGLTMVATVAYANCNCCCADTAPKAKQVVLIGMDGLGTHHFKWDDAPNLKALKERGAWSEHNRSILPSSSAPNWASHMMGVGVELHGYTDWGSKKPDFPARVLGPNGMPYTIFTILREQRPESKNCVVHSWDGIHHLIDAKAINRTPHKNDKILADAAIDLMKTMPDFTLAFFCFDEPDHTGHGAGWGTDTYRAMVTKIDADIGRILKAIPNPDETMIVFISDHGGKKKGHGGKTLEEMEVPFIIAGPGIIPGEIKESMVNYDTASTIAWILGLKQPQVWTGRPIPAINHYKR